MGEYVVKMPDIGEGIAEAEVAEWLVAEGGAVAKDAPMVEVMTDKARVEIPSPVAGTVLRHGAPPGEFIAVGAELVRLTVEGRGNVSASKAPTAERAPEPDAEAAQATVDIKETGHDPKPAQKAHPAPTPGPDPKAAAGSARAADSEPGVAASPEHAADGDPEAPAQARAGHEPHAEPHAQGGGGHAARAGAKVLAAPAVRARAQAADVDLEDVHGTGPDGRVTAADLDAYFAAPGARRRTSVEEIPMRGIRRITAHRLHAAWQAVPHITIVEEVDVTELERLRAGLESPEQPKPTVLPFLIRAMVRALAEQPELNAHFDDEAEVIKQFAGVHVGIATQAPDGLKVPVLRHAEALDLWATAAGVEQVSAAARDGRATREQLGGSTITVTSLGKLGAIATTPLVNKPEVAIVGVNRMAVRPMWDGSAFVPRTMMNLSSSFDHRVIDGWAAATFVARLKQLLETPALIFVPR